MNQFTKARFKLTFFYITVNFLILSIFFTIAYTVQEQSFNKIEQALSDKKERPILTKILENSLANYKSNFTRTLAVYCMGLLSVSCIFSWFLSKKTLKPIQESLEEQSDFATNLSHELRTPLSIIQLESASINSKNYKIKSKSIQEEVQTTTKLIENILYLARPTKNNHQILNISNVSQDIFNKYKILSRKKQINLTSTIKPNLFIKGDTIAIERLVSILLENAMKFCNKNGKVDLSLTKHQKTISLEVTDNGRGIEPKDLPHIFNKYHKSADSTGLGIGLNLAQKIAHNHHTNITVISQLNISTTFSVKFLSSS